MNRNTFRLAALSVTVLGLSACELDLANPNSPTEEVVLSNADGLFAAAIGMQSIYAQAIEDYLVPNSLVTDEWGTRIRSLLSYQSLFTGLSFENTYDVVNAPYTQTFQVVKAANIIQATVPTLDFAPGLAAGVISLTKLFKAMALGMAAQNYEQLPVANSITGGVPLPRMQVFDTVIALLESARADIVAISDADLAIFRTRALGPGVDLRNTIDAMIARYALFRGQHQKAIDAATRVSPTVVSVLNYPAPTTNPVYGLAIALAYVGGLKSFVDQAEAGDRRPAYWLQTTVAAIPGNPADSLTYTLLKYSTPNEAFPLYLPDEMKLIRAEANARLGNLAAARTLINEVRTQATSAIEPAAGLPALTDAQLPDLTTILRQIGYERRYELYMQGLRWEDIRRLGLASPVVFNFLPIPAVECRNNTNVKGIGGCPAT